MGVIGRGNTLEGAQFVTHAGERFVEPRFRLAGQQCVQQAGLGAPEADVTILFRTEPGFAEVEAVVAKLLNDPALQRDQLKELSAKEPLAWAEEREAPWWKGVEEGAPPRQAYSHSASVGKRYKRP